MLLESLDLLRSVIHSKSYNVCNALWLVLQTAHSSIDLSLKNFFHYGTIYGAFMTDLDTAH